ncbi:MAG: hypothetical protein LBG65_05690 [Puniceicoccales bacterium]|jgi:hypothetical protein|nr:hypothetical protein [Puniceicoccales bacterium]
MPTDHNFLPPVPSLPPLPPLEPESDPPHPSQAPETNDLPEPDALPPQHADAGLPHPQEEPFLPEAAAPDPAAGAALDAAALSENLGSFRRFWRKYGGDSFLISVGVHAILAIIAVTWVVSVVVINDKRDNRIDTGAGGGNRGDRVTMSEHRVKPRNARNMARSSMKLMSKAATSTVSLPEMPNLSISSLQSGPLGGATSKGLDGGAGGGPGGGIGPGSGVERHFVSVFGITRPGSNALEGTLYDLKRSRNGTDLYVHTNQGARMNEMRKAYQAFVRTGLNKVTFDSHYLSAKVKLYTPDIFIPPLMAEMAPRAFDCEKEISAPGWLAYYEGYITPPKTDAYRFAGMGDDGMLVAINRQVKLWAPWTQAGMQTWIKPQKDWEPKGAHLPQGRLPGLGRGGRYYGSWFNMSKGNTYFVQIVIAESAGGLFSSELMIQQKSQNPENLPSNAVPLPIFKLAPLSPEAIKAKQKTWMKWTHDGPNFGLEANGLKPRPGSFSR